MRKVLIASFFLFSITHSASSQWRKLADFSFVYFQETLGEAVHCVYFLDNPGVPEVGFVGTSAAVYKTIDGGSSWNKMWDVGGEYGLFAITDICFKDSLVGWFTQYDGGGGSGDTVCYRTTNGGLTWKPIEIAGMVHGSDAVYYSKNTNRLFLSLDDTGMRMSTDLGDHWTQVTSIRTGGIDFFSDSVGVAAAYTGDQDQWAVTTSNGGLTWDPVSDLSVSPFAKPLIIPNSSTCFAVSYGNFVVWRSDDYGRTWRVLKDFGPVADKFGKHLAPNSNGMIAGPLNRLSVLTDSGVYISSDEGITWKKELKSPTFETDGAGMQKFYSAKGVTILGASNVGPASPYRGLGLWEEDWAYSSVESHADQPIFTSDKIEIFDLVGRCVYHGPKERMPVLPPGAYIERAGSVIQKVLR